MKKVYLIIATLMLAATGCERDDFPFSPDGPNGQQTISELKDPGLAWSADSFEATLGGRR